ncbi:MAG: hypothetical protein WC969_08330 [Elusimicrobiota bacterium]
MALAVAASAQGPTADEAKNIQTQAKVRTALIACMKVGSIPEGRKDCARTLEAVKALAKTRDLSEQAAALKKVSGFIASLKDPPEEKGAAEREKAFDALAELLPVKGLKSAYAKYFPPPSAPAGKDGAAGAGASAAAGPLGPEKSKAIGERMNAMGKALSPERKDEVLPGAAPAWAAAARDMHKIWTARNPKTADPELSAFAAKNLHEHGIPWRLALANWDYASSLKPWMKLTVGDMTAEGLTDANWGFCRDHPEAVRALLGREPKRSDMMNPRASILWWIAEYEVEKRKLGGDADPWTIVGSIFLPSDPHGKRVAQEQRRWKKVADQHARIVPPEGS